MQLLPTKRTVEHTTATSGSGVAKGMELSLTVVVFFGIGYLVDRWVGTMPLFTIGVGALGIIGQFVRVWYAYDAEMKVHEERLGAQVGRSS